MSFTDFLEYDNHQMLMEINDSKVGLHGYICIHNNQLGPALGGTRIFPYKNNDEAINDVLRLSKGMTYKNAMAELKLGGGKAVLIGAPEIVTDAYLKSYANFLNYLNGSFITGEDLGFTLENAIITAKYTKWMCGLKCGDPSPVTAIGIYEGIIAIYNYLYKEKVTEKCSFAIQGLGKVGYELLKLLYRHTENIVVADINQELINKALKQFLGITCCHPNGIHMQDVDVFCPCAKGGIINDETIPDLNCNIIAGAANNQLLESIHGQKLFDKDILYAPDYVINAGGVINCYDEVEKKKYNYGRVLTRTDDIKKRLLGIFKRSVEENKPTNLIADEIVEGILKKKGKI